VTYGDNSIDLVLTAVEQETPSSISVNFHSNDSDALEEHRLTSGESAGLPPVDGTGWNNINVGNAQARSGSAIFSPTILHDDLGNNSGVILSSLLTAGTSGSWFVGYAASSAGDGEELSNGISDDNLFNSYLATNSSDNFDLNISGLGPDFTSEGYHLIIYSDSDRRNTGNLNRRSVYTITSNAGSPMTAFVEDDDGAVAVNVFDGIYLLSDGVDDGADYSNYVIVDGLTSSDFTISIDSPDGGRGAISGFQIIPGALPSSPIITLFEADDQYIQPNSTVQLSWETNDADSLILNPGEINVTGLTSFTVNPTENTTYTLTASNSDGSSTESVPVAIGPPRPNILLCLVDDWGVMDTSVPFSYDSYTDGASPVVRAFKLFISTSPAPKSAPATSMAQWSRPTAAQTPGASEGWRSLMSLCQGYSLNKAIAPSIVVKLTLALVEKSPKIRPPLASISISAAAAQDNLVDTLVIPATAVATTQFLILELMRLTVNG